MQLKKTYGLIFSLLLSTGFIFYFYDQVIAQPGQFLFCTDGDGIVNYYTYAYHIRHDKTFTEFAGMNYPYGEFTVFTDCHPVLSSFFQALSGIFPFLKNHPFAVINLLMIFSIPLCTVFFYFIFLLFNVSVFTAVAGSVAVSVFSSQLLLWSVGHYALSYTWFFPLGWYLYLLFISREKKMLFSALIAVNILFWTYIHNYLGFILIFFTAISFLIHYISGKNLQRKNFRTYIYFIIQVILPLIVVLSVIKLFDHHSGRIEMPFGSDYRSSFYNVFLPNYSFTRPLYDLIFDLSRQEKLSWSLIGSYTGLVSNLFILFAAGYSIFLLITRRHEAFAKLFPKNLFPYLIASVILLLFSMAIPIRFGLEFILDKHLPVIKQIQAIGRFAFVFYYVIIVYTIVVLHSFLNKSVITRSVLYCCILFYILESIDYHTYLSATITQNKNVFSMHDPIPQIDYSKYQAVIPLPLYHKFITPGPWTPAKKSVSLSLPFSWQTGLPLVSAFLARPSVTESKQINQLFTPCWCQKSIQSRFVTGKPLLILYTKEQLLPEEQSLYKKCIPVSYSDDYILAELPYDSLFHDCVQLLNNDFIQKKTSLSVNRFGYYTADTTSFFFYENYDHLSSPVKFKGNGALYLQKDRMNCIYESPDSCFSDSMKYVLSFWYYNHIYDQSFTCIWMEERDTQGQVVNSYYFDPINAAVSDGDWLFNTITFPVKNKNNRIVLNSMGQKRYAEFICVDELMVRQANRDYYKTFPGKNRVLQKNNEYMK